jgi:hypothetical protein
MLPTLTAGLAVRAPGAGVRLVVTGAKRAPDGEVGAVPWSVLTRERARAGTAGRRRDGLRVRAGVAGLGRRRPWHLRVRRGRSRKCPGSAGAHNLGIKRGPDTRSADPAAASAAPGTGGQLVTVTAASYEATQAELTAYRRVGGQWRRVFWPWIAWIGRNGMAPPGAKREGDGRTPSGTFGFGFFFGVDPDPGALPVPQGARV